MNYKLTAFPSLAVPVGVYAVFALFGGQRFAASLGDSVFTVSMPTGVDWEMTKGELFVLAGLIALFVDLLKAPGASTATIVNHVLSAAVFVICLVLFLLGTNFVTSPFFLIMCMALLDVVAGFTITIIAARRDVTYGGN